MVFNTSTMCVKKRTFKLHTGTGGFSVRRVGRKVRFTRTRSMGICIATGVLTRGSSLRKMERCFRRLERVGPSTLVVTSPKIFRVTGRMYPRVRHRVDARTGGAGCTACGF